jgi:hypothetical protein
VSFQALTRNKRNSAQGNGHVHGLYWDNIGADYLGLLERTSRIFFAFLLTLTIEKYQEKWLNNLTQNSSK